ncbi:MAG: hypothetical protein EOP24_15270 [Hyphomicrobiales bacterium]|nr:MAG: hypothetical protein EOP24_15270 [Hyphomicrobiales bacterium]
MWGTGYRGFAALDLDVAPGGGASLSSNVELGTGSYSASAHAARSSQRGVRSRQSVLKRGMSDLDWQGAMPAH